MIEQTSKQSLIRCLSSLLTLKYIFGINASMNAFDDGIVNLGFNASTNFLNQSSTIVYGKSEFNNHPINSLLIIIWLGRLEENLCFGKNTSSNRCCFVGGSFNPSRMYIYIRDGSGSWSWENELLILKKLKSHSWSILPSEHINSNTDNW